jgi:hypothetical protein
MKPGLEVETRRLLYATCNAVAEAVASAAGGKRPATSLSLRKAESKPAQFNIYNFYVEMETDSAKGADIQPPPKQVDTIVTHPCIALGSTDLWLLAKCED